MNIAQTHPHYDIFLPTWELLGWVYEGDGPFLDGSALIAHPRELVYPVDAEGRTNMDATPMEGGKYGRRKRLARYENFAAIVVDTFLAHQYAKVPSRVVRSKGQDDDEHPYEVWLEDVDGNGTHIDDWFSETQALVNTYGHVFVVMDKPARDQPAFSKAEEDVPILRVYLPQDTPDWLAPRGRLTEVKFKEAVDRESILEPVPTALSTEQTTSTSAGVALAVEYRVWTDMNWTLYDSEGHVLEQGDHPIGEVPVIVWRCKKRGRIPVIGKSLLGDPKMYRDHFNLISEKRELLRSQTFSMLNIVLGEDEQVSEARARLGNTASTETVMFTKGAAGFIAPPDGPAAVYGEELEALERKMYRTVGLAWEGDSRDVEAAESRRLKAQDLNRILASLADEAERVDYAIARLWCVYDAGAREAGLQAYVDLDLSIHHPDEFQGEEVQQIVDDALATMRLNLGPEANAITRERAVKGLLKDLTPEQEALIREQIREAGAEADEAQTLREQATAELGMDGAVQAAEAGLQQQEGARAA